MSSKTTRIVEMWKAGQRQANIANELGVSRQYVRQTVYRSEGRCACGQSYEPPLKRCARCQANDLASRRRAPKPVRRGDVGLPKEPRPHKVVLKMDTAMYTKCVKLADKMGIGLQTTILRAVSTILGAYERERGAL